MPKRAPTRPATTSRNARRILRQLVTYVDHGYPMRILSYTTGVGDATLLIADCCIRRAEEARERRTVQLLLIDPKNNSKTRPVADTWRTRLALRTRTRDNAEK